MILCKSCGFGVLDTMRYALKSNVCPSCGKTLFGDKHVQEMSAISSSIRSQAFSQSLSDDAVFDVSLFILNNYLNLIDASETVEAEAAPELSDPPELQGASEAEAIDEEGSLELIRDEIRSEAMSGSGEEENEDMRLSRLKRMAKMSKGLNKTGPSVRRVTT